MTKINYRYLKNELDSIKENSFEFFDLEFEMHDIVVLGDILFEMDKEETINYLHRFNKNNRLDSIIKMVESGLFDILDLEAISNKSLDELYNIIMYDGLYLDILKSEYDEIKAYDDEYQAKLRIVGYANPMMLTEDLIATILENNRQSTVDLISLLTNITESDYNEAIRLLMEQYGDKCNPLIEKHLRRMIEEEGVNTDIDIDYIYSTYHNDALKFL